MVSRVSWVELAFPIQNQGSCGSCTAYGWNSIVEGRTRQVHGSCPKLSEADALACAGGSCDHGNTMAKAGEKAVRGTATLECCPNGNMPSGFTPRCGANRCAEWWNQGAVKLASYTQVSGLAAVKEALNEGPIVVDMQVYQSFINYAGGVYKKLPSGDSLLGGHCISLWGYDDDQGCFLLRNSWGTNWGETPWGEPAGERGWCRIAYSEIDHFFKVVPDGAVEPDPPTPSPCQTFGKWTVKVMNFWPWLFHRKGRFYYMDPPGTKECAFCG